VSWKLIVNRHGPNYGEDSLYLISSVCIAHLRKRSRANARAQSGSTYRLFCGTVYASADLPLNDIYFDKYLCVLWSKELPLSESRDGNFYLVLIRPPKVYRATLPYGTISMNLNIALYQGLSLAASTGKEQTRYDSYGRYNIRMLSYAWELGLAFDSLIRGMWQ
jgi:hypothetical protein